MRETTLIFFELLQISTLACHGKSIQRSALSNLQLVHTETASEEYSTLHEP